MHGSNEKKKKNIDISIRIMAIKGWYNDDCNGNNVQKDCYKGISSIDWFLNNARPNDAE